MKTRTLRSARRFTPLFRTGLIAGIAVAVVVFPLIAVVGLGMKASVDLFQSLPSTLPSERPAETSYLYAGDGKTLIAQFYEEYRRHVPIDQIAPVMQQAIVSSEDSRFYQHHGVDPKGVIRAFAANQDAGTITQGASTLTMQYVRNVQLYAATSPEEVRAVTEQTPARKIKEMRLALAVEKQMTKQQILDGYLNVAYFGHRAYGIYAAAKVYFSKSPKDLTLPEAAMLAGLVQAPTVYDPAGADKSAALNRRNYVIDRMVELRYISAADAAKVKQEPIRLKLTDPGNGCTSVSREHNDWGFFCDMFLNWWMAQPAFGANPQQREENLRRGGYTIVSTLDPKTQAIAMREVTRKQPIGTSFAHGVVAIQPGTGKIKAAAVNRVYSLSEKNNGPSMNRANRAAGIPGSYPNTVVPLLGGGDMPGYQAGSTFKIFTMVAALEAGMPLNTTIYAPHRYRSKYLASGPGSCGGRWCPVNASGSMTGKQTMWSGFGKSVNTYFVQLEQRVGAQKAVRVAERLGLRWHNSVDQKMATPARASKWGSFTLGVADTSPLEMANAYATIAAEGVYCQPWPVQTITSASGKNLTDVTKPRCHQEIRADVARAAIDATRCVTGYGAAKGKCGGWSTAPTVYPTVRRPVGGKTGTTDDTRAAWFVGFTPGLAAASFIADPDTPLHVAGDGNAWKPIQTVSNLLRDALKGTPVQKFTPPSQKLVGSSRHSGR